MLAILPMSIALLAQAAAVAQSGASPADPAASPPRKPIVIEGNRRTCTTIVETGSILPKTVCKTADEWDRERAASKQLIDQRAREQTTYLQILDSIRRPKQPK